MDRGDHCKTGWRFAGRSAAFLSLTALLILVDMAVPAQASESSTCVGGNCGNVTAISPYNAAQSTQGSTLGPLDPYGPDNGSTGRCRYVYNHSAVGSPVSFFVPFNTLAEWNDFVNNAPQNYGSSVMTTDVCSRPLLPTDPTRTGVIPACDAACAAGSGGSYYECRSPSPASYFAQPGYASMHVEGGTIITQVTLTTGMPQVGSTYPGVNYTDGTITGMPVPMAYNCTAIAGNWTQTATVQYVAGNSDTQIPSWPLSSRVVAYAGNPPPPSCGTQNTVASVTMPPDMPLTLCPGGITESSVSGGSTSPWTWTCTDSSTGLQTNCSAPVAGSCGTANGQATVSLSSTSPNLCLSTDTMTNFAGTGPWSWDCTGPGTGGTEIGCSAPVKGACGSANGVADATVPPPLSDALCASTSTPSGVAGGGSISTATAWTWSCTGNGGGTVDNACTAPLDGACGAANGVAVASAPTTNLCRNGQPSAVGGTGPWTWTCAGSIGGTTSPVCTAPVSGGTCGTAVDLPSATEPSGGALCATGIASAVSPPVNSWPTSWTWTCSGTDCSEGSLPLDCAQVCNNQFGVSGNYGCMDASGCVGYSGQFTCGPPTNYLCGGSCPNGGCCCD